MLECHSLSMVYGRGRTAQVALEGIELRLQRGEAVALLGPSGSGKTTLLSICGCVISPTAGELFIDGNVVNRHSKGRMLAVRRQYIGFVFQHSQLLPFLTVADNLRLVGRNAGMSSRQIRQRSDALLDRLTIRATTKRMPDQLSGGERQRVAIARALLHGPPIVLADEPTAALDWTNGQNVVRLLLDEVRAANALLVTVTHDHRLVPMFNRVLRMDSGRILPE